MWRHSIPACLGLLGVLMASQAVASISLSATRVVFDGAYKEANITVRNGNQDVLVQSWVDQGDGKTSNVPFAITPPLTKISAKEEQLLRILYEGKGMPTDKESVAWLNVQEIPQASARDNTLQLAVRQRIKIFFRPANLPGNPLQAPEQLNWQLENRAGKAVVTVSNPSLYHVSMADVTLQDGAHKEQATDSTMVAPGETKSFALNNISLNNKARLTFKSINDYGAQKDYAAVLIGVQPNNAKAVEPLPAP